MCSQTFYSLLVGGTLKNKLNITYHHLVNGINYMKHFCLCYVAIIIQVIQFKRPCRKLIDIDVCTVTQYYQVC